jgi:hypothetical protein
MLAEREMLERQYTDCTRARTFHEQLKHNSRWKDRKTHSCNGAMEVSYLMSEKGLSCITYSMTLL